MYKKTLQIQTNFLQEEDQHATLVTTSKINYQQKLQATILFQKSLSMILARNFIECWKQLKSSEVQQPRIRKNRTGNSKQNMNVQYFQEERYNVIQNQISNRVPKARSQSQMQKLLKTSQSEDVYESYRVRRNRSVRVINQQVQHSRATVLKQIVEKLKNVRKGQQSQSQQQDNINKEVLKRISHLQRLVKGIRNTSKSQLNVLRTTIQQHRIYDQQPTQPESNIQDQQLVRQFMDQVYHIRKQVNQIKINNQAILRAELERSQVRSQARSQVSENSSKNRPNSLQQQPIYRKQFRSEGVQTQIHTKNQSQVTEIQPTLSEIQEKHKKLSQQIQLSSKTAKMISTNGASGSSTNLGLGNLFPLGSSNTETNQTDKFQFNTFHKYPGISNPTTFTQKASPPQASDFGNVSSGLQYKPFPNLASTSYSNNLSNLGTSQPNYPVTNPSPPIYTSPSVPSKPFQQNTYQIPSNMSFTSPPTFNIPPQPQPPINYPPRQPTTMIPSFNAPMNIPPPMSMKPTISFQYPKYDHIRTNTSVESKNYIISDLGSANSLMTRVQPPEITHYRQPSFFVHQETRRNVALSTYCATCGRSCGCPTKTTFNETRRF